ncbi:MAG: tetratricopeptide repeat protein [Pseudomonadota bacterium]
MAAQAATPEAASEHLAAGRLAEAEAAARAILQADPRQPEALHVLGVVATATGHGDQGADLIQRALAERGNEPTYHFSLGNALRATNQPEAARASFERAVRLKPDFVEAQFNLALTLEALGLPQEAEQAYLRVADRAPGLFQAQVNLGNLYQKLYRYEAAVEAYGRALAIKPDLAEARSNLGNALMALGRSEEALAALREAVARRPDFAMGHFNLGVALQRQEHLEPAIAAYRQALSLDGGQVEALYNLGTALRALRRLEKAEQALRQAVGRDPDHAQAHAHLAGVLLEQGDGAAALALCDDFLSRHPGNCSLLCLKALVQVEVGQNAVRAELLDMDRLVRPTRLAQVPGYDTVADFNRALAEHVLAHPTLAYAPPDNATRKGWHSGALSEGPVADLAAQIETAAQAYRAALPAEPGHPFLGHLPARWRLTIWSVVLEAEGHQLPHIHPTAWLSGVYYAEVPEVVGREAERQAGWIEFGRPGPPHRTTVLPPLKTVQPEEGLMVLFPSYLYHRTIPFEGDGRRISVAFDLIPEG